MTDTNVAAETESYVKSCLADAFVASPDAFYQAGQTVKASVSDVDGLVERYVWMSRALQTLSQCSSHPP